MTVAMTQILIVFLAEAAYFGIIVWICQNHFQDGPWKMLGTGAGYSTAGAFFACVIVILNPSAYVDGILHHALIAAVLTFAAGIIATLRTIGRCHREAMDEIRVASGIRDTALAVFARMDTQGIGRVSINGVAAMIARFRSDSRVGRPYLQELLNHFDRIASFAPWHIECRSGKPVPVLAVSRDDLVNYAARVKARNARWL